MSGNMSALSDILLSKHGCALCAGTQFQDGHFSRNASNEPSERKKMRYLSHFYLFIKAGFIAGNIQLVWKSNLSSKSMILKKIKK